MLQTHGWEVCGQAENGEDAVRMTVELNPDVVILDLAMPSMDGLTAARQISESLPTIPIVLHTLHDLPQLELEAKKNGVSCIVPKSESVHIISVIDELTSARVSARLSHEKEPAPSQATYSPATDLLFLKFKRLSLHRRPTTQTISRRPVELRLIRNF